MVENRQTEWDELEAKASAILENLEPLLIGRSTDRRYPTLRLSESPSFEPYRVWAVFETTVSGNRPPEAWLRRAVWERGADLQRLRDPMTGLKEGFHTDPSVTFSEAALPRKELAAALSALSALVFPAFAGREVIVLDGIRYGIEMFGSSTTVRLSWSRDSVPAYGSLSEWFQNTTNMFDDCLMVV